MEERSEENREEKKENLLFDNSEQNTHNQQKQTEIEIVWYFFSILSWTLLILCQIEAYITAFFNGYSDYVRDTPVLKLFILMVTMTGFVIYLIFTTCNKDENLYNWMLGRITKFHFICFIFVAGVYMVDQFNDLSILKQDNFKKFNTKYNNGVQITSIVFGLISIISLIFFYINIALPCDWYIVLIIRKGTFSCLIPYIMFKILDGIYNLVLINIHNESTALEVIQIILLIGIGLVALCLSFLYTDICIAFTNFLIYLSYLINYSSSFYGDYVSKTYLIIFEVITIIMIFASFCLMGFLIIAQQDKLFK